MFCTLYGIMQIMQHTFRQSIDDLICWADKYGYQVSFLYNGDDSISGDAKYIEINSNNTIETQLYTLLHECGHLLIYNNGSSFEFSTIRESFSEKSNTHKVFTVIEEVEAWKRGRILAKRLGMYVDDDAWNRRVCSAIKKYMVWATS